MSQEPPSLVRQAAGQAARHVAKQAARKALSALATKAAALFGAKAGLIIGLVVLALVIIGCGLMLLLNAFSAALQQTTAPWPVSPAVQADGAYQAGGWAISSRFGWRRNPTTGQTEFHDGIDIVSPSGVCPFGYRCMLPSLFDGVVSYVGWDQSGVFDPASMGGGEIVIVENGNGDFQTTYAHLEPYRLYVQLQGRIVDEYGRYDDYADYQPIGAGELTPVMSNGSIAIWCANDMPNFRAARSGATITFLYDRPASCRTAVTWEERSDDWDGWVADDPPADGNHIATLAWQTPLWGERGDRRAGDVALRFRAHLEPPPPPPTATPVTTDTLVTAWQAAPTPIPMLAADAGQGGVGQGWNLDGAAVNTIRANCRTEGIGTTCVWRIADIPLALAEGSQSRSVLPALPVAATPTATIGSDLTPTPAPIRNTPTPVAATLVPPWMALSISALAHTEPIGKRFPVAISAIWQPVTSPANAQPIRLSVNHGGMLKVLDVQVTNGTCGGTAWNGEAICTPDRYGVVFLTAMVEILPTAPKNGLLTIQVIATADGVAAVRESTVIQISSYTITLGPWPPPPLPPTSIMLPPTTMAYPSPVRYPTVISSISVPPPGGEPGESPLVCEPQQLVLLPGVVNVYGSTSNTRLIAPAAASFAAVRAELIAATGADPLERLADGLRAPEFRSDKAGVALMSWHMTGRAIDLDTSYPWRRVREGSMWRLYLGSTDVTALFARHGWNRIPDHTDSLEWWHYEYHPDGIDWASAMVQVWPLNRLHVAFPQIAWGSVGCQAGTNDPIPLPGDIDQCVPGLPSFGSQIEELPGCGPPVQAGDRVYQLESPLGFVGLTGQTSGPHLHLGLRQQDYRGGYPSINICTPEWLRGMVAPADVSCWTDMADPLAFLPLAPPDAVAGLPEGAPYQLPPPNYPGALYHDPAPDATPVGQYWSPNQNGGRYGGGTRTGGSW